MQRISSNPATRYSVVCCWLRTASALDAQGEYRLADVADRIAGDISQDRQIIMPDQVFIPRPGESTTLHPDKFKPIHYWSPDRIKPSGGIWTSDFDPDTLSPWAEHIQYNMRDRVVPSAGIYRPIDPERLKAYEIDNPDDYERLKREFARQVPPHPGLSPMLQRGPKETLDYSRMFAPKSQGGGGLDALRVTEEGLYAPEDEDEFDMWDIPTTLWGNPHAIQKIGDVDLKDFGYEPDSH